ncbi:ATP-binding protein [Petroclostridium sp. X23]|uniref:sensor histidine kinase n=1 Tax=Petroclostridium sp. X23 TaxID=3045146 RepID=UPI0024ACB9FD|nr:ATP-binding protein [Petroclostridium sp. X23]WHH61366.1 ATP-binding protein [Petroclostridium sp. X23]
MSREYLLYYLLFHKLNEENKSLKREVKELTEELMETNTGVLALIQEFEKSSNELQINDKQKAEFLEKLRKSNKEQIEKIKAQEQALIQADKMASLGQLVAGVAHEINNPTTYIRANIELLQKYWNIIENTNVMNSDRFIPYVDEFKDTLESMHKGTDRIMDIVSGLKFFSRQEKVAYEVFDLYGCFIEVYKLIKNEFIRNKINYFNNIDKDRFFINGSRQQMEQIFINLFLNSITAIKVSDSSKSGFVEIDVKREGMNTLSISVRDNGCGIGEKNLNKIFNPFFTTNQAFGGTGLGLSIVYGIIKEHGGNIQVRSKEKQGTEFIITLPEHQ